MSASSLNRRVRMHPTILPGESLQSYLFRSAKLLGLSVGAFSQVVGLRHHATGRFEPGFGLLLPDAVASALEEHFGLSREELEATALPALDGPGLDLGDLSDGGRDLPAVSRREWVRISGTAVCPDCLAEDAPYWRLEWRSVWSFACVKHRRVLVQDCPECGYRIGMGRRDGRTEPLNLDFIPSTTHCRNPKKRRQGATPGYWPCDHDLRTLPSASVEPTSPVLAAQAAIEAVRDGSAVPRVGGDEVAPDAWFADVRALIGLILYAGSPALMDGFDGKVRDVFTAYAAERDAVVAEERRSSKKGSRHHGTSAAPSDPALMAAVASAAVQIVAQPTQGEFREAFRPLVGMVNRRGDHVWTGVRANESVSRPFLRALGDLTFRPEQVQPRLVFARRTETPSGGYPFSGVEATDAVSEELVRLHLGWLAEEMPIEGLETAVRVLVALHVGAEYRSAAGVIRELAGLERAKSRVVQAVNTAGRLGRSRDLVAGVVQIALDMAAAW